MFHLKSCRQNVLLQMFRQKSCLQYEMFHYKSCPKYKTLNWKSTESLPSKTKCFTEVLFCMHHNFLKVSFGDSIKCFTKSLVWNNDVSREGLSRIQNVSLKVLPQIQNVELKVYWKSSLENKMFHFKSCLEYIMIC